MSKFGHIFYVYRLRVDDDELPFYIGKGKETRAWDHFKEGSLMSSINVHKNNKIKKAKRLGKTLLVELIRENITDKQSQRLEKYWIAKIGRADLGLGPLTNMTNGGEGVSGWVPSIETRNRISEGNRGKVIPQDIRNQISDSMRGTNSYLFGKAGESHPAYDYKHTEEAKNKISVAKLGILNPMYGKVMELNPMYGRKHSLESREKMSIALRGQNHPFYGKTRPIEHGIAISSASKQFYATTGLDIMAGENNPFFGRTHSDMSKEKMKQAAIQRPKLSCPYCDKIFNSQHKWRHFDNCKMKGII